MYIKILKTNLARPTVEVLTTFFVKYLERMQAKFEKEKTEKLQGLEELMRINSISMQLIKLILIFFLYHIVV